jgi:ArsR family transcriptional regulator
MYDPLFRAFAEPVRRRALRLLTKRALCVCDIVSALRLPQPTVSRHLGALQKAGLVDVRRGGKWRHYSLRAEGKVAEALVAGLAAEGDGAGDLKRLAALPGRTCA